MDDMPLPEFENQNDGLDDMREAIRLPLAKSTFGRNANCREQAEAAVLLTDREPTTLPTSELAELALVLGIISPRSLFRLGAVYGVLLERKNSAASRASEEEIDLDMQQIMKDILDDLNKKDGGQE